MKKNSSLLIIFLSCLISVACSPRNEIQKRSLAQMWQEDHLKEDNALVRSLASTALTPTGNSCLGNFFNVEILRKEVQEAEGRFKGQTIQGSWKHLDYSQLPLPQANFLSKYGNQIGDLSNSEAIDYSDCQNLICVFNKIYGKDENYIAGYVHYLWYLKFRNYLSLDNRIYEQSSPMAGVYRGVSLPLSSYLYSEDELYGFWRFTNLLREPFTTISAFTEIQRLPRGLNLEGTPENSAACGYALMNTHIRLADGCLKLNKDNKDVGFFYLGILHEMAHLLDYDKARKERLGSTGYNSERAEYLDFIGFKKEFQTNANGTQTLKWVLDPSVSTVRDYARVSPVEHFADTLAYYRFDGDHTKKSIDAKTYEWIKSEFYHDEVFSQKDKKASLLNKYITKNNEDILFSVFDCVGFKGNTQSYYLTSRNFSGQTIDFRMVSCLSEKAENIKDKLVAEIVASELEGCHYTKESERLVGGWYQDVKEEIAKKMSRYVQMVNQEPALLQYKTYFKDILKSRSIANTAFLECYDGSFQKNVSVCYQDKLKERFYKQMNSLNITEDFGGELYNIYNSAYSYSDVVEKLLLAYESIIDTHQERLKIKSEELWNMCLQVSKDDIQEHVGTLFISKGYLISSFANCLNLNIQETIMNTLNEINYDGSYIRYPAEELIFKELMTPRMLSQLEGFYTEAKDVEKKSFADIFSQYSEIIKEEMLADLNWLPSLDNQSKIIEVCKMEGFKKIDYLPLYHIKRDFFGEALEKETCQDILKDQRFESYVIEKNNEIEKNVFSRTNELLEKYGEERALSCIDKIPGSGNIAKKIAKLPRKACLSMGWKDVEEKVVEELLAAEDIKRYDVSVQKVERDVSSKEDRIKKIIEEKHF